MNEYTPKAEDYLQCITIRQMAKNLAVSEDVIIETAQQLSYVVEGRPRRILCAHAAHVARKLKERKSAAKVGKNVIPSRLVR